VLKDISTRMGNEQQHGAATILPKTLAVSLLLVNGMRTLTYFT